MPSSPPDWRPARALTHPLFLAGLLLLALNDHLLKGSGLLPGALTGKLSDVAGLLVAPLTLAWLARVRSPRAWLACHVAVGVGFSLLQAAPVTRALGGVFDAVGVAVWADPTDLLALPSLAVSWLAFGPRAPVATRRPASPALGLIALLFCTATSPNETVPRYPFPPAGILSTDVFVRHMASDPIEISVRRVRDEHEVDCEELLGPPGPPDEEMPLEDGDFGDERRWTLLTGDAVPLWDRRGGAVDRECYAVRLRARDREWLVTWRQDTPPMHEIEIRLEPNDDVDADAVVIAGEGEAPPRVPEGVRVRRWR